MILVRRVGPATFESPDVERLGGLPQLVARGNLRSRQREIVPGSTARIRNGPSYGPCRSTTESLSSVLAR